jgi:hypothetical protein
MFATSYTSHQYSMHATFCIPCTNIQLEKLVYCTPMFIAHNFLCHAPMFNACKFLYHAPIFSACNLYATHQYPMHTIFYIAHQYLVCTTSYIMHPYSVHTMFYISCTNILHISQDQHPMMPKFSTHTPCTIT